jgi:hypothetical protein
MLIQQLNRTDPERVQLIVLNTDGSGSMTTGIAVALNEAGNSIDGVGAIKYALTKAKGFAGIAAQDIAINSYGRVTAWGYAASVQVSAVGTSITVTAGDILKPGAVAGTLFSGVANEALSTQFYKYVYVASTLTISANPVWVAGVVRAL